MGYISADLREAVAHYRRLRVMRYPRLLYFTLNCYKLISDRRRLLVR